MWGTHIFRSWNTGLPDLKCTQWVHTTATYMNRYTLMLWTALHVWTDTQTSTFHSLAVTSSLHVWTCRICKQVKGDCTLSQGPTDTPNSHSTRHFWITFSCAPHSCHTEFPQYMAFLNYFSCAPHSCHTEFPQYMAFLNYFFMCSP